jgi:hypothetical protein
MLLVNLVHYLRETVVADAVFSEIIQLEAMVQLAATGADTAGHAAFAAWDPFEHLDSLNPAVAAARTGHISLLLLIKKIQDGSPWNTPGASGNELSPFQLELSVASSSGLACNLAGDACMQVPRLGDSGLSNVLQNRAKSLLGLKDTDA